MTVNRVRWPTAGLAGLVPLLVGGLAISAGLLPVAFGGSTLVGTDLGAVPAPDFRLSDERGEPVSLAGLRGEVVVLTFLYTSCPDTCPLVATKLGQVHRQLGEQASEVAFLAVTVDPERDTPARARQFLEAHGLSGRLVFLTGDRAALEPVWAAYHVAVTPRAISGGIQARSPGDEVGHTDALYIIDKQGRERRLLRSDFAPAAMLGSLDVLMRQR